MKKFIYNERNGPLYELQCDYYIPSLKFLEEEQHPIGVWEQRHLQYIKQNRKVLYLNSLTSGRFNGYLAELKKQAADFFSARKTNGRAYGRDRTVKSEKPKGVGCSDE